MNIFLVRHGRPESAGLRWISGRELGRWVAAYDECGLDRAFPPPDSLSRLVASAECVIASDLRRSLESARWLAPTSDVRTDSLIREAALPDSLRSSIHLPAPLWVVLARVAWWLNWMSSREDVSRTRERAAQAAQRLSQLAEQYRSVALVGHGMFNRFVASQLRARGWRGPWLLPSAHWSCATFVL